MRREKISNAKSIILFVFREDSFFFLITMQVMNYLSFTFTFLHKMKIYENSYVCLFVILSILSGIFYLIINQLQLFFIYTGKWIALEKKYSIYIQKIFKAKFLNNLLTLVIFWSFNSYVHDEKNEMTFINLCNHLKKKWFKDSIILIIIPLELK